MNALIKLAAATLVALAATGPALAQDAHAHGAHASNGAHGAHGSSAEAALVAGEIKKVDKQAGKVTIRHAELKNLGMGAMTMVFRVKDPAMLDQVKAGDKVNFAAEKVNGALTVVQIEAAK